MKRKPGRPRVKKAITKVVSQDKFVLVMTNKYSCDNTDAVEKIYAYNIPNCGCLVRFVHSIGGDFNVNISFVPDVSIVKSRNIYKLTRIIT